MLYHNFGVVSLNKILYGLLWFDLLVVLTPLKIKFPFSTQFTIGLIALIIPFIINWRRTLKNKYVFPLILSYVLIFIFALFEHGPSINEYLYRFTRLLPLFFAGIIVSKNQNWIANLILISLVGALLGSLELLNARESIVVREELANLTDFLGSPYRYMAIVIISILALYLFQYFNSKRLYKSLLILIILADYLIIIKSGFSASIICLLIGLIIIGVLFFIGSKRRSLLNRILILSLFLGFVVLVYYGLVTLAPDSSPSVRITEVISYLSGDKSVNINVVSGLRVSLISKSINSFLSSPILGVGSYAFLYGTDKIGGHSTIFDMFAQFGLIGGSAIISMLLSWIFASINLYRHYTSSILGVVLIGMWSSYFAGCIMNPYLFSAALDHYVFVFAGITIGLTSKSYPTLV